MHDDLVWLPAPISLVLPKGRALDFDLKGFPATQALRLVDQFIALAHSGSADHLVVDPDRVPAALGHSLPST